MNNKKNVLAIDLGGNPIDIIGYEDCFRLMSKGKAIAIDTKPAYGEEYATHMYVFKIEDWFNLPHAGVYIPTSTSTLHVPTPEIIVLTETDLKGCTKSKIRFTKEHLLIRDKFKCAYCGCDLSYNTVTIDHVIPRSNGGGTSWANCVSACRTCNFKKMDHDPVGIWKPTHRLYTPSPYNPDFSDVGKKIKRINNYPKIWDNYLKK